MQRRKTLSPSNTGLRDLKENRKRNAIEKSICLCFKANFLKTKFLGEFSQKSSFFTEISKSQARRRLVLLLVAQRDDNQYRNSNKIRQHLEDFL